MKEYTITNVSIVEIKMDGTALIDRNGKKFQRVGIQVAERLEFDGKDRTGEWANALWFDGSFPYSKDDRVVMRIFEELYEGELKLKFQFPKVINPNQKYFEELLRDRLDTKFWLVELVNEKRKRNGEPPIQLKGHLPSKEESEHD